MKYSAAVKLFPYANESGIEIRAGIEIHPDGRYVSSEALPKNNNSKRKTFSSNAQQFCTKCNAVSTINSSGLCSPCARVSCYKCKKPYRLNIKTQGSAYCAKCREKNRNRKSEI